MTGAAAVLVTTRLAERIGRFLAMPLKVVLELGAYWREYIAVPLRPEGTNSTMKVPIRWELVTVKVAKDLI